MAMWLTRRCAWAGTGLLMLLTALARAQAPGWKVFETQSQYQRITIWDTPNGYRQMIFDGKFDGADAIQSEMKKASPLELTLAYSKHMITGVPLVARPKRILIVGLGGACIQRYLYKQLPEATLETAELDPAVLTMAKRFFEFQEDGRQKVAIGDGRKFIQDSKDKYDLIMLDAFSATSIPYMLATKEFLQLCKDHLAEGGIVDANLWDEEADYNDMLKTYDAVFPEWHVLKCPGSSNAIVIALPVKEDLTLAKWKEKCAAFDKTHTTGLDLGGLVQHSLEATTRIPVGAKVLLDADAEKRK